MTSKYAIVGVQMALWICGGIGYHFLSGKSWASTVVVVVVSAAVAYGVAYDAKKRGEGRKPPSDPAG